MRFHFGWKYSIWCSVSSLLVFTWMQYETQTGMDFISVILTEMKFQTDMRFSCEQNLPEAKWISSASLDIAYACAFETHCGHRFHIGRFDRNKISFRVIKYHVNTTRNETPTHVRLYIGSFWNAAEMKSHVKRTCFHAGLKSQTGMSSFRLSCERTLRYYEQTFSNFSITL